MRSGCDTREGWGQEAQSPPSRAAWPVALSARPLPNLSKPEHVCIALTCPSLQEIDDLRKLVAWGCPLWLLQLGAHGAAAGPRLQGGPHSIRHLWRHSRCSCSARMHPMPAVACADPPSPVVQPTAGWWRPVRRRRREVEWSELVGKGGQPVEAEQALPYIYLAPRSAALFCHCCAQFRSAVF